MYIFRENSFTKILDKKEFLLSDLIGLEFYIYSCKDINENSNIQISSSEPIISWLDENTSMKKKLSLYKQNYNSAFPVYNLEILDRILPNESIIENMIDNQNQYGNFIELFYNTIYSLLGNINMDNPTSAYLRNPIINPLLDSSDKSEYFKEIFSFVFSKETAFLNIDDQNE